jgi:hypothetical protein
MSPGEIAACYRLYAAHRRSNEICAFPEAILAMDDVGASAELAVLLRLHSGLEGLQHEISHGDPKDDLRPAVVGHFGRLRKIRASLAAQFCARVALVGRLR